VIFLANSADPAGLSRRALADGMLGAAVRFDLRAAGDRTAARPYGREQNKTPAR
jgi:hypothetical protein